jgi:hypothetical protein
MLGESSNEISASNGRKRHGGKAGLKDIIMWYREKERKHL